MGNAMNRILEGLDDRYVKVSRSVINKANKIAQEYCGYMYPYEIPGLYEELEKIGITIGMISGMPKRAETGAKSWSIPWYYNGKEVENSWFVYQVYEPLNSAKNEYNIYFS